MTSVQPRAAGLLLAAVVLAALLGPSFLPPPDAPNFAAPLAPPSRSHPFGTDDLGRDLLARTLVGGRLSLGIAAASIGVAFSAGVPFGLAAGFAGGWADQIALRVIDLMLAFPAILVALGLAAAFGPSAQTVMAALVMANAPWFARIARLQAKSLSALDFVAAARAIGRTGLGILARHIAPNAAGPLFVEATSLLSGAILLESTLSFLGLGLEPPTPSWGGLLRDALGFLHRAPWMAWFPGLVLFAVTYSLSVLGDALRDAAGGRREHAA